MWTFLNNSSLKTMEFFLNVFTKFSEFNDKNICLHLKGLEPATSHVRHQDDAMAPAHTATHM